MATELRSADAVIDALGGSGATANLTNKTIQAVSNWRRTKLPASTYLVLSHELEERGYTAPASLWGIEEPQGAQ